METRPRGLSVADDHHVAGCPVVAAMRRARCWPTMSLTFSKGGVTTRWTLTIDSVGDHRYLSIASADRCFAAGETLWLRWKTLSGSQVRLRSARRESFASPSIRRVWSGPTPAVAFA